VKGYVLEVNVREDRIALIHYLNFFIFQAEREKFGRYINIKILKRYFIIGFLFLGERFFRITLVHFNSFIKEKTNTININ
jgi:hypothetical protein